MLNLRECRNSRKQGDIGLVAAMNWFVGAGHDVYLPLTDSQDTDLVVDIDGKLCRVQVRTTYFKTPYGIYQVHLHVSGGNRSGTGKMKLFDAKAIDYLFVLTDSGEMYCIPTQVIDCVKSLNLGDKYQIYKVTNSF